MEVCSICANLGVTCGERLIGSGRNINFRGRLVAQGEEIDKCPVKLGDKSGVTYKAGILAQAAKQRILDEVTFGETLK